MADHADKGVIDAADRVIAALLESPSFKNSIRLLLNNIDPDSAERLVRTVMWRDMEFSMSVARSCAPLANALINLAEAFLSQIDEKIPDQMLRQYTGEVLRDIDLDALERVRNKALAAYTLLAPVIENMSANPSDEGMEHVPAQNPVRQEPGSRPAAPEQPDSGGDAFAGAGGVLAEILDTPFAKEIFREILSGIDPEKGALAVRHLMWRDPEFMLSVLGALPSVVNYCIKAAAETADQVNDKLPPQMLVSFTSALVSDIDIDAAKKGAESYKRLARAAIRQYEAESGSIALRLLESPALARGLASALNAGAAGLNRLEENNPGTLSFVISRVVAQTDKSEVNRAAQHAAAAVLDQRPPFFAMAWRAAKLYMSRIFKRNPG